MFFEGENKRVAPRKRLGVPGLVRLEYRIVRCMVKDISEGGAMLVFDEEVKLPPRTIMSLGERPGHPRHIEVAWQTGTTAGVRFVLPPLP